MNVLIIGEESEEFCQKREKWFLIIRLNYILDTPLLFEKIKIWKNTSDWNQLWDRDLSISSSWWHINEQVIQVVPLHLKQKSLDSRNNLNGIKNYWSDISIMFEHKVWEETFDARKLVLAKNIVYIFCPRKIYANKLMTLIYEKR